MTPNPSPADLERQCHLSGQMSAAQSVDHFGKACPPAAPQGAQPAEPVAWRWREALMKEHWQRTADWGDWHLCEHRPQGPADENFQIEPLYASPADAAPVVPQEVRMLTEDEVRETVSGFAPIREWAIAEDIQRKFMEVNAGLTIPAKEQTAPQALAGPLEQPQEPKSDKANLAQASGGDDLQTALFRGDYRFDNL